MSILTVRVRMKLVSLALAICLSLVTSAVAWTHGTTAGPYDGLAITRGSAPSGKLAQTQAMARTAFFTRDNVDGIEFFIANWFNGEIATGGTLTVNVSIEYPLGHCSNVVSASIASGGQVKLAKAIAAIPAHTQAWFRGYFTNPSGIPYGAFQGQNLSLGDALVVGNSGVADQTSSCTTVVDGGTTASIAPLAGVASITNSSVCILGDSTALGVDNDHTPNATGDNGIIAPSISLSFGYSLLAVNGESASDFVSNHINRGAILPYCTTVSVVYGTNDLELLGHSVAQLKADLTTIYGLPPVGTRTFQNALIARTNCATTCATLADQTPVGSESKRVAFNSDLISGLFGPNAGFFDPQSVVGTGTNFSIWKAGSPGFPPCVPNWTNEGVHPDTCAQYQALQSSGYLDTSRIHR